MAEMERNLKRNGEEIATLSAKVAKLEKGSRRTNAELHQVARQGGNSSITRI